LKPQQRIASPFHGDTDQSAGIDGDTYEDSALIDREFTKIEKKARAISTARASFTNT